MDDIPFIPECEFIFEHGPNSSQLLDGCMKNPGHPTFIPVEKLTIQDLPLECQTSTIAVYIKRACDRTVKITVTYCSESRPANYPNSTAPYPYKEYEGRRVIRCGTGFIENTLPYTTKDRCPCPECEQCESESPKMEYLVVQVSTVAHVVFDDEEAKSVRCELFYDSNDSSKVKYLYGVNEWNFKEYCNCGSCNNDYNTDDNDSNGGGVDVDKGKIEKCMYDSVIITCVTHDSELIQQLLNMCTPTEIPFFPLELIVSHPHGSRKHISFGKTLKHILPVPIGHPINDQFIIGRETKCQLAKGAPEISRQWFEHFLKRLGSSYSDKVGVLTLQKTMKAVLPPNAQYMYQVDRARTDGHCYFTKWVQFSPYTKFIYGDDSDNDSLFLPHVEFQLSPLDQDLNPEAYRPFYVTYNIDTCPGCSGAPVMIMDEGGPYFKCHSGALRDGTNRSETS